MKVKGVRGDNDYNDQKVDDKNIRDNMASAVLLIDVQNEFTNARGNLHEKVKNSINETKMMENLPPFVKKAR